MSQPYVGEIRMFAGNYSPEGWEFCQGQLLLISENEVLFSLIGTTYGGDGQTIFGLPDLRGRVPVHQSNDFVMAETGGAESVNLSIGQLPAHSHSFSASTTSGTDSNSSGKVLAASPNIQVFRPQVPNIDMAETTISSVGGSQIHENRMPYLCINFIISLFGIFPSPS